MWIKAKGRLGQTHGMMKLGAELVQMRHIAASYFPFTAIEFSQALAHRKQIIFIVNPNISLPPTRST